MNRKIQDVKFLSLFMRPIQSVTSAIHRFLAHSLFDIHLVLSIYDYLQFPLVAPLVFGLYGCGEKRLNTPKSICFHPITGQLWVADHGNQRLCIYNVQTNKVSLSHTIACQAAPICLRISNLGRIVCLEKKYPYRFSFVVVYNDAGKIIARFGVDRLKDSKSMVINNTLQQLAIPVPTKNCIEIFTLQGKHIRTLKFCPSYSEHVCWNEHDNLLYISGNFSKYFDKLTYVIDMKTDGTLKSFLYEQASFEANGCMVYDSITQRVLIAIENDSHTLIMDTKSKTVLMCLDITHVSDMTRHPHDTHQQLFFCHAYTHCINVIQMVDNMDCQPNHLT